MDFERAALVICVTLFIVIGFNAAIYASVMRRKGNNDIGQIELFRRAAQRAKKPWEGEDNDLQELSRRVGDLKSQPRRSPEDQE